MTANVIPTCNPMKRGKLEKLESLRGFAALYVVVHHFNLSELQAHDHSYFGYFLAQGQLAVILFFVLSGFVIQYASHASLSNGDFRFRPYFVRRFRRIYPTFLCALGVSYAAHCVAQRDLLQVDTTQLIGNLVNLQDHPRIRGVYILPFFGNGPLWSLSYEWWFYLLYYPVATRINNSSQKYVAFAISLVGFFLYSLDPNKVFITLEYFVIWWTGVELARCWMDENVVTLRSLRVPMASLVTMIALSLIGSWTPKGLFGGHQLIEARHFIYALFCVLGGVLWQRLGWFLFNETLRPFILFAPISYGLYVFHAPLTYRNQIFHTNSKVSFLIGLAAAGVLSYAVESIVQPKINRISARMR